MVLVERFNVLNKKIWKKSKNNSDWPGICGCKAGLITAAETMRSSCCIPVKDINSPVATLLYITPSFGPPSHTMTMP